jgi:Zn-dependent protease with chaperone function
MISNFGAFFSIWLVLWLVLSATFVFAYPLLRASFLHLHPRYASSLMLVYWGAPLLGSLLSAIFLFTPITEILLVDVHCHGVCESHVTQESHAPQIGSKGLAWFGLTVGVVVLAFLLQRLLTTVVSAYRLDAQFCSLAKFRGEFFRIATQSPLVFTLGWWDPKIFISDGLASSCTDTELSIILKHELAHKKRRDNLRLLFARLSTALLSAALAKKVIADIQLATEQTCDFYAAEKYGHIAVAETLLKVKRLLMASAPQNLQGAVAFADSGIESRVLALLNAGERITLKSWQVAALVASAFSVLMVSVAPLHHGAEWVIAFVTGVH